MRMKTGSWMGFPARKKSGMKNCSSTRGRQLNPNPLTKSKLNSRSPLPKKFRKKPTLCIPIWPQGILSIIHRWAPKSDQPVPIPLIFSNRRVDSIVKRLVEKPHEKIKLCFLGPRFENTFYAWMDRPFPFPYSHIKSPQNMKFSNRAFCGQHWDAEDGLIFDSFF